MKLKKRISLKKILKPISKDLNKKRLFENFISLSILQIVNYIFPLVTLPYLVRVLGPEKFGLIAFAQAFIQYFIILTDYGFKLSATREISIYRNNKQKISEIFSSVMVIKFFLLILSFIIITAIVFTFKKFKKDWLLYYLTFGMVGGQVLFPVWFFQGMEKMRYITFLNIVFKLIFTVCIFIFVKNASNYIYVPLINSLGSFIIGALGIWLVFRDFKIIIICPSTQSIKHQLIEGWYIFISTLAISLYTISNTFILGLFTNNVFVGYYSSAEKLIKAIQSLLVPISQTIYPYISNAVNKSKEKGIKLIKKATLLIGGVSFILSIITFIFSKEIVSIVLGREYSQSVYVLKILAFLPFIVGLSNVFGIQTMLTFNFKKAFSNILISASLINTCLALILAPLYKHIGISFAVVISEIIVTISMFIYLNKKGIKVLEGKIV